MTLVFYFLPFVKAYTGELEQRRNINHSIAHKKWIARSRQGSLLVVDMQKNNQTLAKPNKSNV